MKKVRMTQLAVSPDGVRHADAEYMLDPATAEAYVRSAAADPVGWSLVETADKPPGGVETADKPPTKTKKVAPKNVAPKKADQ